MMPKYRIIHCPAFVGDPCVWQLQERMKVCWLFWKWVEYANFSSATSAGNEILLKMKEAKAKGEE